MTSQENNQPATSLNLEVWGLGQWANRVLERCLSSSYEGCKLRALDNDRQGLICSLVPDKVLYQGPESVRDNLSGLDLLILVLGLGSSLAENLEEICCLAAESGTEVLVVGALPFKMDGLNKVKAAQKLVEDLEKTGVLTIVLNPDRYLLRAQGDSSLETVFEETELAGVGAIRVLLGSLLAHQPARRTLSEVSRLFPPGLESTPGYWEGTEDDDLVHGLKAAISRMNLFSRERLLLGGVLICLSSVAPVPLAEFRSLLMVLDDLIPENSGRLVSVRVEGAPGSRRIFMMGAFPRHADNSKTPGDFRFHPVAPTQATLDIDSLNRGMFADTDPNLVGGEDLDIPTFIRRGERLD